MKKLNLFWKIVLIVLLITTTASFGILTWNFFIKLYGRSNHSENFSRGLEKIYFHNGTIRVYNTQTRNFTTPKLDWIAACDQNDSLVVFSNKCKKGYLSLSDGKIAIPEQYQAAWMFSEGLGAVVNDNKLGFINSKGQVVIPLQFSINPIPNEKVDFLFKNGYCTMTTRQGIHGIINKMGEWVVQPQYDYIRNPRHGFRVVTKDNKAGLLDSALHIVLPLEYDAIAVAEDGVVVAKDGLQKKLAFDMQTVIKPYVYDELDCLYYSSGKVDTEGEDILVKSEYFAYKINEKYGLMGSNGKVILRAKYDNIIALTNDLFSGKTGEQLVIFNSKGEEVN